MEDKTKKMLEDEIQAAIAGLKSIEKGTDKHKNLSEDIGKLMKCYMDLAKFEKDAEDSDRKFREDVRSKDLERDYKDTLERDKLNAQLELEREKFKAEMEQRILDRKSREILEREKITSESENEKERIEDMKKNGKTEAYIKAAGIGSYFLFLSIGMLLEFKMHGSITSFSVKELFRALHPKPL